MKNPLTGNSVSYNLLIDFEKEVNSYARTVQNYLSDRDFFGLKMSDFPVRNLDVIKEEFIKKGEEELKQKGVRRYRSISRNTFETLMDELLTSIQCTSN